MCFDNVVKYTSRLNSFTAEFETEAEREAFLFTPGYWLRRWQSDDSELFPSFYRAYHRQLARYLGPVVKYYEAQNKPVPTAILMRAPGYAHLATVFAKKLYSYIMGTVNAVTTYSTASNFDATESALQASNSKPPVLITANRRLTETMITFSEQRITIPVGKEVIDCEMSQVYMVMIDLWTKNLINKTSLNAPKGVFCLFDLLDGIVDPPYGAIPGIPSRLDSVVDITYLIHVVRIILTQTEHAMTLVKTIAFIFSHWEVMTARAEDRKELCLDLLLDKEVFERLLLFWSHSVRSYMLRLVVSFTSLLSMTINNMLILCRCSDLVISRHRRRENTMKDGKPRFKLFAFFRLVLAVLKDVTTSLNLKLQLLRLQKRRIAIRPLVLLMRKSLLCLAAARLSQWLPMLLQTCQSIMQNVSLVSALVQSTLLVVCLRLTQLLGVTSSVKPPSG